MKTFVGVVLLAVILGAGIYFVRFDPNYRHASADVRSHERCTSARSADDAPVRLRYFLVRRQEQWAVRIANADAPMSVFANKGHAERFAVAISRASCPSQLFIQGEDGRFEEERTFGGDDS